MKALDELLRVYKHLGGDPGLFDDQQQAHLVVVGHEAISSKSVAGLEVMVSPQAEGVQIVIRVQEGVKLKMPVHTCLGLLHDRGEQHITFEVLLEPDASASFVTHCLFPNAVQVRHTMQAKLVIGSGASMGYQERHFHGPHGGVVVIPQAMVQVAPKGSYQSCFTLVDGLVGQLSIDYDVQVDAHAVAELAAHIFGHASDRIRINERIALVGEGARSLIKTRVAVEGQAQAEVTGSTAGKAAGARGHVDCLEIVRDHAVARAVPIVCVTHPQAKVTHEASIGSVDHHQLETLMAHGVSPEEAVAIIVKGMLAS